VSAGISPEDRVGLARYIWEAYDAGDIDAVLEAFHPEIEIHASSELANAGTFRGREEFVRWVAAWNEAWESFRTRVVAMEPVGERHVVVGIHQIGTGRGSGVEVSMDVGYLFELRDGRCVHIGLCPSFEEALAVAREREGVEPEGE
jgi:uncharacterized protein